MAGWPQKSQLMKIVASFPETRRNPLPVSVTSLLLYIAIAFFLLKGWRIDGVRIMGIGDAGCYVWFLNWWPWSILHHVNPFHSNIVWYPTGQNLTWTASVPTLGLLASPITLLLGPVWSFNILTLLSPALGAWTAFLLCRHLTGNTAAALVAGFFFGFAPYEMGHLIGHLNLDAVFLIPALVHVALLRLKDAISRRAFVGSLAVLLAMQAGISIELFAASIFFAAIAWAVFMWLGAPEDRQGLWRLAFEIVAAGALCGLLISPWLFFMYLGRNLFPGVSNYAVQYSNDALNFVVPTVVNSVGGKLFSAISAKFTSDASGQNAYLGLPALLILAVFFVRNIERPRVRALLVVLAILAICSLGPSLWVAGVNTGLPLPWAIGVKLPLMKEALPQRFALFTALAASLAIALFLAWEDVRKRQIGKFALAGLACLFILPVRTEAGLGFNPTTPAPKMPFFERANIEAKLGPNPNVIILPYAYFARGMTWQAQADMSFTQSGGYLGETPTDFAIEKWLIAGALINGTVGPNLANDLLFFCQAHHVTAILVTPGAPPALVEAIRHLNWQTFTSRGVEVFRVPLAAGTGRPG